MNNETNSGLEKKRHEEPEEMIRCIRGQWVIIDKDLADLYGVSTKALNQQVKRNIERFPEDFMFQLTMGECLRSQIATLNPAQGQHLKYCQTLL